MNAVPLMTSKLTPTLEMMKKIKLIDSFADPELERLISLGTLSKYEAHTNVIIENEPSWGLYIILEGTLRLLKTNKLTGQSYEVCQLSGGNAFGEMSLVDDNPRSATLCTLTACDLFFIPKTGFLEFLNLSTDLKLRFYLSCIQSVVTRLRELDDNYVVCQYQLWQSLLRKENRIS